MKICGSITLMLLGFVTLAVNAQTNGCHDPQAQVCKPGQYADTSGNQLACLQCTGNSVANGCTRSCSECGSGTIPNADHSSCVVKDGCGDSRSQVCSPGQYADTSGNQLACVACTGNSVANGCTRSCNKCGPETVTNAAHASCVAYPPGTYLDNSNPIPFGGGCQPTEMDGGTLHASCPNYFGIKQETSLGDADKCVADKHDIENINGSLRCVISSQHLDGGHPYTADIISIPSDVKTNTNCLGSCPPNQETIVTRIDQPRVDVVFDAYRTITFKPGDTVALTAGGCVQTGGTGLTWKSYVHPRGVDADRYYSGTVFIDGVQSGFQRLSALTGQTLAIPLPTNLALKKDLFLSLGYEDNSYANNGYWGHDDGDDNQCKDIGPAWVEVTVIRQLLGTTNGVSWSPHTKPFDLVWDVNNEDYNGLPMNPMWGKQLDLPGSVPDFTSLCGSAIRGGNTINYKTLANNCTSQTTRLDVDTSSLVGDSLAGSDPYCTGLINGHLNWTIATYTGQIYYDGFSGDPNFAHNLKLADGDYNLDLGPWGGEGLTTNENSIGLEFKDSESIWRTKTSFWAWGSNNPQQLFDPGDGGVGLRGVVTGVMSIDGVHHGGVAELHPVFALGVEVAATTSGPATTQTWAFFLRTTGNDGGCSEGVSLWPSNLGGGTVYYMQLPLRGAPTAIKLLTVDVSGWQDGTKVSLVQSPEPGWLLIKVQFPSSVGDYGVDGQFTVEYDGNTSGDQAHELKRSAVRPEKDTGEDTWDFKGMSLRISDPAVRTRFTADTQEALKAFAIQTPVKRIPVAVDPEIKIEQRTPGAASRGEGTPAQPALDPLKKHQNEVMKKLLDTYRPQMGPAPLDKK
jgi:hypothetical protein